MNQEEYGEFAVLMNNLSVIYQSRLRNRDVKCMFEMMKSITLDEARTAISKYVTSNAESFPSVKNLYNIIDSCK